MAPVAGPLRESRWWVKHGLLFRRNTRVSVVVCVSTAAATLVAGRSRLVEKQRN